MYYMLLRSRAYGLQVTSLSQAEDSCVRDEAWAGSSGLQGALQVAQALHAHTPRDGIPCAALWCVLWVRTRNKQSSDSPSTSSACPGTRAYRSMGFCTVHASFFTLCVCIGHDAPAAWLLLLWVNTHCGCRRDVTCVAAPWQQACVHVCVVMTGLFPRETAYQAVSSLLVLRCLFELVSAPECCLHTAQVHAGLSACLPSDAYSVVQGGLAV